MSVFISGATGYIARHTVGQLLDQNYKVIGTCRSQTKCDQLQQRFGNNPNLTMEIVEDISKLDAFDGAIQKHAHEIKHVLHMASPVFFTSDDFAKDILVPAVNGTEGILTSIKKYAAESVESVVVTFSYAALTSPENEKGVVLNEDSWNPDSWEHCQRNGMAAYCGSKKFAEEAAWKFLAENKDVVKFKLATVNPVYVFGPQKFDADVSQKLNSSCEIVNQIIHSTPNTDLTPLTLSGYCVDVRDVAKTHVLAIQNEELLGHRLIMSEGRFDTQAIMDILNESFPVLKGKIAVGNPGTSSTKNHPGTKLDDSRSRKLLKFKYHSFEETMVDMASQILKHDELIQKSKVSVP
ncbi:SDR family oxidoreductase KNAG_0H03850 [Huiozyma naganishii CBS 8797]|uniref:NAD-dependent epimerase/dehydratase domain-containing protein n=1 Tax=Huiozyma naganishii (strain ATCC MYA-139 / BCRC 22969 / CBS 8797 / KCTC 17520 / NBRC 10181 / NCYC 3082 / Yp74L-3) TaxID=1071383 RepID=J7S8X7_HUIN7|nr:hypothetical protein KNAG_0H03850 [Kazachstania naganishii CBS 8797]CCK71799.1 hypothetical protein KNAG_0H03850 [Kazachstania naganishii CBS 8797]